MSREQGDSEKVASEADGRAEPGSSKHAGAGRGTEQLCGQPGPLLSTSH